jgi:hypothetical protein
MDDVVTKLQSEPQPFGVAAEAVPAAPGLYAWWAPAGGVPGIDGPAHPSAELELLYVGIAPNGAASKATLRSRLVRNHIRGTTGQSTLRRALASLLSEREGWRSRWTMRPVLVDEDETRLSLWMGKSADLGRPPGALDGRGRSDRAAAAATEPGRQPPPPVVRVRQDGSSSLARGCKSGRKLMTEAEVVEAFTAALRADGWEVQTEVRFIDVIAERDGQTIYAEAKGTTTSAGLDADTMYGQLLRRMPDDPMPGLRFAVVVPEHVLAAVLRVPASVRALLRIDVYAVTPTKDVRLESGGLASSWTPSSPAP